MKTRLPGLFRALSKYNTPLSVFMKRFRFKVQDGQVVRADAMPRALRPGAGRRAPKPFRIDTWAGGAAAVVFLLL